MRSLKKNHKKRGGSLSLTPYDGGLHYGAAAYGSTTNPTGMTSSVNVNSSAYQPSQMLGGKKSAVVDLAVPALLLYANNTLGKCLKNKKIKSLKYKFKRKNRFTKRRR